MLKKFLIGTFVVAAMSIALTVSASYDFGSTTLRVGSTGDYVKTLQTLVGANPDGNFGPMTAAKVKAWQASNGLVADGVFGPMSMAKANLGLGGTTGTTLPAGCQPGWMVNPMTGASCTGTPTTPTTPTPVVTGGAGDSEMTHYSTSEKSSFGEGEEGVKALGFKVEAIDSDVSVTNLKVRFTETETSASYKLSNYVDSVDIYKGSTKVGSADASDFTKTSGTPNYYTKSIAVSDAIVKEGDKDPFYVVVNATDSIDTDDEDGILLVEVTSYRFQDGSGVVSTVDINTEDNVASGDYTTELDDISVVRNELDIDVAGADDGAALKASSANPTATTVAIDENDITDDVLVLAFKMDAEDDSSDIKLTSLPITLTFADNGTTVDSFADSVIESVMVKIGSSDPLEADLGTGDATSNGAGTAIYTLDLEDEDVVLEGGDVVEVKVYITLNEQDGNYANLTTVAASIDSDGIEAETDADDTFSFDDSDKSAGVMTLSLSKTTVDVTSATSDQNDAGTVGTFTFKFSIEASDEDVTIDVDAFDVDVIGGTSETPTFSVVKNSGTATTVTAGAEYTVTDGNSATFTATFTVEPGEADTYYVQLNGVAGVTVEETAGPETLE